MNCLFIASIITFVLLAGCTDNDSHTVLIPANGDANVFQIIAGTNVTISPTKGTGIVTINASDSTGGDGNILGGGTANKLSKFVDLNHITNSQIFDDGNNIGIGMNSPVYKLDIIGPVRIGGDLNVSGIPKYTSTSFNCANTGCAVLFAKAGTACNTVCSAHGLACNESIAIGGVVPGACDITAVDYFCACGG